MSKSLHRAGNAYVIAGTPYQPARPAYTSWQSINVLIERIPVPGGGTRTVYIEVSTGRAVNVPDGSPISYIEVGGFWNVTVPVNHPATPEVQGTPPQRIESPPAGWTSFARSIAQIPGPGGIAGFKVPPSVTGVAIGLSASPSPPAGYSHIRHGLFFTGGVVRSLRSGASYGAFSGSDAYTMSVRGGVVTFRRDGVDMGSEPSTYAPGEPLHLSAALFRMGDSVDEPSLVADAGGTSIAALPALRASTSEAAHAESLAVFPALQVSSGVLNRSTAVLPAVAAFSSDRLGGSSLATMPALDVDSYGGTLVVTPKAVSFAGFPAITAASLLLVGETGTSEATLPGLIAISADRPYGASRAEFPALTATSNSAPLDRINFFPLIMVDVPLDVIKVDTVDVRERLSFDVAMSANSVDVVRMEMAWSFVVAMSAGVVDTVDVRDSFALGVVLTTPGADLEVHAVNLEGYGSTTYSGFPFNSFARIGDRYYGAALGGLFLLDGDTDDGAPIPALIGLGERNFGTPNVKAVSEAYFGMASDGHLVLKVRAMGCEYEYRTRGQSEHMREQRIDLGKGLSANYVTLSIENEDGCDFEIDTLQFNVVDMKRNI